MTTTDNTPKTAAIDEPTTHRKDRDRQLVNAGNIATAVAALGISIALGLLLPLSIYKVVIGIAFVVAVVSIGMLVHRRFFKAEEPTVEEAPDGR